MKSLKILHVLSTPRAEGTPNLVLDWLTVHGHEQEVFILHRHPPELAAELRERAVWYGEAELFQGRGASKFTRIIDTVRRVCLERQPVLLVCWPTGFGNWVAAGARLALGGKVRLLVHCGNPPIRGSRADWISRSVLWPLFLLGGRCVCCSDYVRDLNRTIPGVPDRMFTTVYNCARVEAVRTRAAAVPETLTPTKCRWAIMVATLERHKDHATLLRALPEVLAGCPEFALRLVGDGSLRSELEALTDELGIRQGVEFLGSRRDVPEWLGRSELFIFSTTMQEGLGSVLLEALAAGLPVVASDVPACRELLKGGRFGQLVAPGDAPALAGAILAALQTEPDAGARERARDYTARFTPERMVGEYLGLVGLAAD